MRELLRTLIVAPPDPAGLPSVEAWWTAHRALAGRFRDPIALAAAGGFAADRLGWAFASGYQAALGALLPGRSPERAVALCATEERGGHPREIHTALTGSDRQGWRLSGRKRFVTLGTFARQLVVLASTGRRDDGRNRLRAVLVDAGSDGVSVEEQPPLSIVPEVPHGAVRLEDVAVPPGDVLPGDGYAAVLEPFRTVEDLHVLAAAVGYAVQLVRRGGGEAALVEELLATLCAIRALAGEDPLAPEVHVALGGLERQQRALLDRVEGAAERVGPDTAARWRRDRPVLSIAARVRQRRLDTAWRRLAETAE